MQFNTAWSKILIVILILFFYSLGLVHQINLPTEDLGRHIKNGEIIWQTKTIPQTNLYSYSQPDYPFLNHHWLSGLIFYFIFQLTGFNGLIIFKTILLLAAFLLVFVLAVKKGGFWLAALFSLPIIFILNERTVIRPEIFSYLFISIFLYLLINFGQKPGWKIFWLVPLQLLWVNLHIYFPIGILMTAGYILGQIICRKKNLKKLFLLLLLLILVCLANPSGLQGVLQPLKIFQNYGYQIVENKSPFFLEHLMDNPAILFFKITTFILILSFLFNLKRFSPFLFLASTSVVLASCQMIRNFPLLGLIALPVLSINLKIFFDYLGVRLPKKKSNSLKKIFPWLFILFLLVIILLTLFNQIKLNNKQRGFGLTLQSTNSAAFFKKEKLVGPIFNNYDIGSYLIFELYPQEKIFVDNRPEAYPASFFEEIYKPIQLDEEKWQLYSEEYSFNIIFFTHQESTPWGRSFLIKRLADPDWALIQADAQAVILIKSEPANQPLIKKFQITKENIEEKISSLIGSSEIKMRIAALNLLELMARYDLALQLCQEILQDYPQDGRIYLEMAVLKSRSGKLSDLLTAKRYLEKAIQLGQDLPSAYVRLGLIHFQLNQYEEAKKAWEKALQINKDNEHAKEYLKQYQSLNLP